MNCFNGFVDLIYLEILLKFFLFPFNEGGAAGVAFPLPGLALIRGSFC